VVTSDAPVPWRSRPRLRETRGATHADAADRDDGRLVQHADLDLAGDDRLTDDH